MKFWSSGFGAGLAFRIAALLAISLLPIGLIAVFQTAAIERDSVARQESSLLALTAEAAGGEESLLRLAYGALSSFAITVPLLRSSPENCNSVFKNFVAENREFSFAGFVNTDGIVECGSNGVGLDVSHGKTFQEMKANPKAISNLNVKSVISQTSIVSMSRPLAHEGFDGYVSIYLPHSSILKSLDVASPLHPLDLVLFNADGEVLSAEGGLEHVTDRLPRDRTLKSLADGRRASFTAMAGSHAERVFAVVPIVPGNVFAIGNWPSDKMALVRLGISPLIFPVVMWLTSFAVAYMAVHRMAIRHIHRIASEIREFIVSRRVVPFNRSSDMAAELLEIDQTWHDLADTVVHDEADLEATIHDKTVLLKEVHHRVKNNLQLIGSIVNLKVRKASTDEAREALQEVRIRVMSIAIVHNALYDTSNDGRVRADVMIDNVVSKTINGAIPTKDPAHVTTAYDAFELYPDQALPLSMLASEAVTNAVKYVGWPADGEAAIKVKLSLVNANRARLEVENTTGTLVRSKGPVAGAGLGGPLMSAFARQLFGTLTVEDLPDCYRIVADFPIKGFSHLDDANLSVE